MPTFLSATNLADLTGTSLATAQKWGESGVYPYHWNEKGKAGFFMEKLTSFLADFHAKHSHMQARKAV